MEQRDLELIQKYESADEVLANLYKEHLDYEKELEELEEKHFLTPEEEVQKAKIKKKKLMGRDQMESILSKYRASENRD